MKSCIFPQALKTRLPTHHSSSNENKLKIEKWNIISTDEALVSETRFDEKRKKKYKFPFLFYIIYKHKIVIKKNRLLFAFGMKSKTSLCWNHFTLKDFLIEQNFELRFYFRLLHARAKPFHSILARGIKFPRCTLKA